MEFLFNKKFLFLRKGISIVIILAIIATMIPSESSAENTVDDDSLNAPKELEEFRTATSKLIDNGDGTFTKEKYFDDIHRKTNDTWEEISETLVKTKHGKWTPKNTEINAQFEDTMVNGKYVTLISDESSLSQTFLGVDGAEVESIAAKDVVAEVKGNIINYSNTVPDISIRNRISNRGIKEDIVLSQYNGYNQFRFKLNTDLKVKKDEDGGIIFTDQENKKIYHLPKPYMEDSYIDPKSGEPSKSDKVTYEIEKIDGDWILTIIADEEWLESPERIYPVFVDPTAVVYSEKYEDTFVMSAYPNQNYVIDDELKVGYYDNSTGRAHSYLKQKFDDLAGVTVDSATLKVYTKHTYSSSGSTIYLDLVKDTWYASTLNWTSGSKLSTTPFTSKKVTKGSWASFDVTEPVKNTVLNKDITWGFKLHTNGAGTSQWTKFYASDAGTNKPHISITYHLPTPKNFTAQPYANMPGSNTGYVYLKWDQVEGATGYKVGVFNGKEYQYFDVGNSIDWTSQGKGIWPTVEEIASGKYTLHTDGKGTELASDPSLVYKNVPNGTYHDRKNYAFRVIAYHPKIDSNYSVLVSTIPSKSEDLGEENFWNMSSVPGGKFNTLTGNLFINNNDVEVNGRGQDTIIRRVYNSRSGFNQSFGYGWFFSFDMNVRESNGNVVFTESDGTAHTFIKKPDGSYLHPLGVVLELSKSSSGYTIKNKDQTMYYFNSTGKLTKVVDSFGNELTLIYDSTGKIEKIKDASARETILSYNGNAKIETITDPAGNKLAYEYENDLLVAVTDPEGKKIQYTYNEDRILASIKSPKHKADQPAEIKYYYESGKISKVNDPLNRETAITYDSPSSKTTVTTADGTVTEYAYNNSGNPVSTVIDPSGLNLKTSYQYDLNYLTEFKDPNANKRGDKNPTKSYTYDANGNMTSVTDASGTRRFVYDDQNNMTKSTDAKGASNTFIYDGKKQMSQINPANAVDAKVYADNGNILANSKMLGTANNFLINAGLDIQSESFSTWPDSWSHYSVGDEGYIALDSSVKLMGNYSIRVAPRSNVSTLGYRAAVQELEVEPNQTYTISGYIKTKDLTNAKAFFNTEHLKNDGTPGSVRWIDNRYSKLTGTQDWTKRQLTFTTGSDTKKVRLYLEVDHKNVSTNGYAWFDNIQLEKSMVSTDFNPIENSSFEDDFSGWYRSKGNASIDSSQFYEGEKSIKMTRSETSDSSNQYVYYADINQTSPQAITVSGLSKASGVSNLVDQGPNKDYSVYVDAILEDGSYATDQAKFSLGSHEWQRAAVTLNPSQAIKQVRVYVLFRGNNTGTVWFDNIRIQKGRAISTLGYDDKGNYITNTTDVMGNSVASIYDEVGNKITNTDAKGNVKHYSYDNMGGLVQVTEEGMDYKLLYVHDNNGNIIERKMSNTSGNTTYSRVFSQYNVANEKIESSGALGLKTLYKYNLMGQLNKVTSPDQRTVEYSYDKAGRQTEEKLNGELRYKTSYDPNGNVIEESDLKLSQVTKKKYDNINRMTEMIRSDNDKMVWKYDSNSNMTEQTVSVAGIPYTFKLNYDVLNQNNKVTDPQGKVTRFDYDEYGNLHTSVMGNGSGTSFEYNEKDQVRFMSNGKDDGSVIGSFEYTYDKNGKRTRVVMNDPEKGERIVDYTYDTQGKLISETDYVNGTTLIYSYDVLGNRMSKKVTKKDGELVSDIGYRYNEKNQLVSVDGRSYQYDTNGNLIDDGVNKYVWDEKNYLVKITKKANNSLVAEYDYDQNGRRIRTKKANDVTNFIYDGNSQRVLYETNGNGQLIQYYNYSANGGLLNVTKKIGDKFETYYYHYNAHGDVVTMTDSSNSIVANYTYDAWGNILEKSGSFADENPYRYAGYRYDNETGFYYLMSRYYRSDYGNFISLDPAPGDADDILTLNGYSYGNGDPANTIDPLGEYIPGYDGERFVENPITGWGRMTGNKKYPEHNGKYRYGKQVTAVVIDIIGSNRNKIKKWRKERSYEQTLYYVKSKLRNNGVWDYKKRNEYKDLEFEHYGKTYAVDKFGNMNVGAAANELGIPLEVIKQYSGYYQGKYTDQWKDKNCWKTTDLLKGCDDAADLEATELGYTIK
ncbi:DNRLRE domain-containing protein [Hazenella sp. IB182357]|uniref:DNRLRE domain-containing protein n=1 Tax=Polycladospora coralii TaxID=2771432 RepID=A0A926RYY2_9BACL|nr:DNRLRE domain-containing protein [Polycladospora coralii]MBD1373936.1 DNRLRE domain-containing protein [Polycladospora coralii]